MDALPDGSLHLYNPHGERVWERVHNQLWMVNPPRGSARGSGRGPRGAAMKMKRKAVTRKAVTRTVAARGAAKRARQSPRQSSAKRKRTSGVPAWVRAKGYTTWAAYMASIRPAATSARGTHSTQPGGHVAKRKTKSRRRPQASAPRKRRYRRNPPMSLRALPGMLLQGVQDAGVIVGGKALSRIVPTMLNLPREGTTGIAVQALTALGVGFAGQRAFGGQIGRLLVAGAFSGPIESAVKKMNVPLLSPSLGDEDGYQLGSYAPAELAAYPMGALGAYPSTADEYQNNYGQ